ncbi:stage III sporulation protein AH [Virgibacillus profundi]|uniref:Stage III sporulation protein AH n=1 Tax=Virgibacillus profundi TaxID=2024555 RepID=A0A2A2IC07_9BACI|nr:SpoIIIAH-like family protein [Virgibacillus profundi]PAV29102.1 stage III sporulation protein AH [Virgibacillus profundi]PXY53271.1 SpoIIIAH-like family protein [Virgibacillus profundi]
MLKKQTVWLLTMLSLMIVLSVYYMTSDMGDQAYVNNGQDESEEAASDSTESEDGTTVDDIANIGGDELYTSIRMELEDSRSTEIERLEEIVTSASASIDEKDKALKDIDVLEEVSSKEKILEQTISDGTEYGDVLVRSEEDKVHVSVMVDQLSNTEVVNIMQLVRDEFGEIPVNVDLRTNTDE